MLCELKQVIKRLHPLKTPGSDLINAQITRFIHAWVFVLSKGRGRSLAWLHNARTSLQSRLHTDSTYEGHDSAQGGHLFNKFATSAFA